MSEDVLIGGEPENVYRQGDEIVVSGTCRIYADEAVPLAIALLKVATLTQRLALRAETRVGPGEPGEGLSSFIRYVTDWTVDE